MTNVEATICGAILGAVIAGAGTYFGAIRIANRERKAKLFNDTAETLRIALIKTIQRLDIGMQNSHSIIREDFLLHDELRRRFELCLGCKTVNTFKEAWNNYKYWHDNIAAYKPDKEVLYPADHPKNDDPTYKKANETKPKDLINELITLAEYK